MVKNIVRDVLFLGQKSEPATQADIQVAIDLQDTLHYLILSINENEI